MKLQHGLAWCLLSLGGICPLLGQFSLGLSAGMGGALGQAQVPPEPTPDPGRYTSAGDALLAYEAAFGSDLSTRLRLHYTWTRHLNLTLDASYVAGGSRVSRLDPQTGRQTFIDIQSPRFRLSPGLVLSTGWRVFSPYLRAGVMLPGRHTVAFRQETVEASGSRRRQELAVSGRMSTGVNLGLGMTYRLGDRLSLFYELEFSQREVRVTRARLLSLQRDDEDLLAGLDPFQIETGFKPLVSPTDNFPQNPAFDPQAPLVTTAQERDLRSMQATFGILLSLN